MKYLFSPEARQDIVEVAEYYDLQRDGLGLEFVLEVGMALGVVLEAPNRWPEIAPDVESLDSNDFLTH
ncbi:MAG TPA: hypothetical protein VGG19_08095 [Tepidisphaeraceae bacterium]|jgi:hypothetical protein